MERAALGCGWRGVLLVAAGTAPGSALPGLLVILMGSEFMA